MSIPEADRHGPTPHALRMGARKLLLDAWATTRDAETAWRKLKNPNIVAALVSAERSLRTAIAETILQDPEKLA